MNPLDALRGQFDGFASQGLETAVRSIVEKVGAELINRYASEVREKIIATITGEPPAHFQAGLIAQGWNFDAAQARVLWQIVFRTLCDAPAPQTNVAIETSVES